MSTRRSLDKKFTELEEILLQGYDSIGRRVGVPFIVLIYPPDEELTCRREIENLRTKLTSRGLTVRSLNAARLLLEKLREDGVLEEAITAEKENPSQVPNLSGFFLRALRVRIEELAALPGERPVIFLERVGSFYRLASVRTLQEQLVGRIRVPLVIFVPADDRNGQYLLLGLEKTEKYRAQYI